MLPMSQQQIGGLDCRVFGGEAPDAVVVVAHGFGAPGDDLVPLGMALLRMLGEAAERVRVICPAAPIRLDEFGLPGGRAWWPIDMLELQMAIEQGEFRNLRNDCPDLLPVARERLLALIAEVREETGLELDRFVLSGFSQGSMLSTDVALHLESAPGALVVWSGTLLCEEVWRELAPNRAGLRVVQSHGRQDPILPYVAAEWLRDMLSESGLQVEFLPFNGMHEITEAGLGAAALEVARVLMIAGAGNIA